MEKIEEIQEGEEILWKIFLKILFVHKTLCILSFVFLYDHINIFNRVRGLDWNFGKVARVPTILKRKAGTDGHERKWEKAEGAKEVEKAVEWQRERRENGEHPPHLPPDLTIHYRHTICQSPILHIDSAIY